MKPPYFFHVDRSKRRFAVFFCLYIYLLVSYCIVAFVYIFRANSDFGNNTFDYFLLLENWRQGSISDIVSAQGNTCPTSYSPLIPYKWGGSKKGCNCIDAISVKKISEGWPDIDTTSCSASQYLYGCSDIDKVGARDMPYWHDGVLLCIKRNPTDTFMNQAPIMDFTGGCPSPYIKCGSGDSFNNDRVFCSSADKCPINSVVLSKTPPSSNYKESIPFDAVAGSGYSIYWSRMEANTLPIVEWRVSEEKMCLNNKVNYLSKPLTRGWGLC